VGERSFAMTLSKSFIAGVAFILENIERSTFNFEQPASLWRARQWMLSVQC
jgi:hypothetical protein